MDEDATQTNEFRHLTRVDTDILDETMQYLEIEEGPKKIQTLHNYYVIPQIKSLDFLNMR